MDPEDGDDDFDDIQDFDDTDDQQAPPEDQDDGDDQQAPPEDQDDGDDQPPARKPSRAEARIETLDRELRATQERLAAAERRAEEALNGRTRTEAEARETQERERLAKMLPEERAEYIARQTKQELTGELSSLRGQIADSTDRAEFATACATNPALAKVKDKVEAELVKLRATGSNVPRGTLAAFLIGQSVLEKAPKARERAARRGAANLDRERARPAGGASDAPRGRELSEKAARDKRLEDFTF